MKTAMQELIENLSLNGYDVSHFPIIINALEKEKEQIIDAFNKGYIACDLDEALEINRTMFNGDYYYNKVYQNK